MKIIQKTQIYCTLTIDGSLLNAHYFGAKKKKKRDEERGKDYLRFIPDRKHFDQIPKLGARIVRIYSPLPSEKKGEKE